MCTNLEKLQTAVAELQQALNYMGPSKEKQEAVKQMFGRMHRTLQQEFMRTMLIPILQDLAESERLGYFDARNEASCKLASRMLSVVSEDDLYLPFI